MHTTEKKNVTTDANYNNNSGSNSIKNGEHNENATKCKNTQKIAALE